jgi:hypothetical protein
VTGLVRGPDVLCAEVGEAAFCWGPGAKAHGGNADGIFTPSPAELATLRDAGAAPNKVGVVCAPEDDPSKLFSCTIEGGSGFSVQATPALGLASREDVRRLALGSEQACLLVHGRVHCYGGSWSSLRGQHAAGRFGAPNEIGLGPATDLVALGGTTCALVEGDVFCWGRGSLFPPGSLPRSPHVVEVEVSYDNGGSAVLGCVREEGGTVACGAGEDLRPVPQLHGAEELAALASGEICARFGAGRVACVGTDFAVRELPELEPASRLAGAIPCALVSGEVRCARWEYSDNRTRDAFEPATLRGLGAARGLAGFTLNASPGACAITERGTIACWGVVSFDWKQEETRHLGAQWIVVNRAERTPIELPGPRDAVEITRSGCVRTRSGEVWIVAGATPESATRVRLAARTAKGANGAVSLLPHQACGARRADGSEFVLVPDWPIVTAPASFGPVRVEAPEPSAYPELPPGAFVKGGDVCARSPDASLLCQEIGPGRASLGPVFDVLARSTLPRRVIPADAVDPRGPGPVAAPLPADQKPR